MDWTQFVTLIGTNFTFFFATFGIIWWFRKESREDIKQFRSESRADWERCQNTIDAIKDEMKDFHERLLRIEMNRK